MPRGPGDGLFCPAVTTAPLSEPEVCSGTALWLWTPWPSSLPRTGHTRPVLVSRPCGQAVPLLEVWAVAASHTPMHRGLSSVVALRPCRGFQNLLNGLGSEWDLQACPPRASCRGLWGQAGHPLVSSLCPRVMSSTACMVKIHELSCADLRQGQGGHSGLQAAGGSCYTCVNRCQPHGHTGHRSPPHLCMLVTSRWRPGRTWDSEQSFRKGWHCSLHTAHQRAPPPQECTRAGRACTWHLHTGGPQMCSGHLLCVATAPHHEPGLRALHPQSSRTDPQADAAGEARRGRAGGGSTAVGVS